MGAAFGERITFLTLNKPNAAKPQPKRMSKNGVLRSKSGLHATYFAGTGPGRSGVAASVCGVTTVIEWLRPTRDERDVVEVAHRLRERAAAVEAQRHHVVTCLAVVVQAQRIDNVVAEPANPGAEAPGAPGSQ